MAKPNRSGSKQRKARNPKNKPERPERAEKPRSVNDEIEAELLAEAEHTRATMESARLTASEDAEKADDTPVVTGKAQAVTINERQIASDTLSLSGDGLSDFIARVSDFMQANGKIILSVVVLALVVSVGFFVMEVRAEEAEGQFKATVNQAKNIDGTLEGREALDAIITSFDAVVVEDEPAKLAYYWYAYSEAYFNKLVALRNDRQASETMTTEEIQKDNEAIKVVFQNYRDVVKANPEADPAHESHLKIIDAKEKSLTEQADFRVSKHGKFLKNSGYWESEAGKAATETKMIAKDEYSFENGNPIIVFETEKGPIRIRLFELLYDSSKERIAIDKLKLKNTVATIITLVERGYYDGQMIDGVNAPLTSNYSEVEKYHSHYLEFGRQGMLPRKAKDNESEEDAAKAPEKEARQPDFTILEEKSREAKSAKHREVMLLWNLKQHLFRGTRLGINLSGQEDEALTSTYQTIGEVADDESFVVARSLTRRDVIFKAWVAQKRTDTMAQTGYVPLVLMLDKPNESKGTNTIPVLWAEKDAEFIPPSVDKVESPTKLANKGTAEAPNFEEGKEYKTNNPVVVLKTSQGDIVIELFEDQAPNTVKNFIYMIQNKLDFLKESQFSADTANALLVGGNAGDEDIGYTIESESEGENYNLRNVRGTISMKYDNAPNSANSRFAFNLDDNLDRDGNPEEQSDSKRLGSTVFGKVLKNFWALSEFDGETKIEDAWVVQLRDGVSYDPMVLFTGDFAKKAASKGKDDE